MKIAIPHFTCGTCGYRLNRMGSTNGDPTEYRWVHGPERLNTHTPDPVLDAFFPARLVCDFCSADATWSLGCRDFFFQRHGGGGSHSMDESWATCDECAVLVHELDEHPDEHGLERLALAALATLPNPPPGAFETIKALHREFLANRVPSQDKRF